MKEKRLLPAAKPYVALALLLLAPLALRAQAPSAASTPAEPAPPAASAALSVVTGETGLASAGIAGPATERNLLTFGADFSAGYDDNIAQTNANRLADSGMTISPRLALNREDGRLGIELDYRPTFRVYRHHSAFNEQDQALNAGVSYTATNRLLLHAQTNVLRRSGLLGSLSASTPAEPGPVGTLNQTVVTPFAHQFEDDSRTDILYAAGHRATLGIFATYMLRSFAESEAASVPLLKTEGASGGLEYTYRAAARATIELTYLYEVFHTGPGTHLSLNSASAALALALTPQLTAYLFAGPAYAQNRNVLNLALGSQGTLVLPFKHSNWQGTAGGRLTWAAARQRLLLTGSRQLADGGGLFGAVTSEFIDARFERQWRRGWNWQIAAGWDRNAELGTAEQPARLGGAYGRFAVLHPVSESLSAGVGYQYQRQHASGSLPLGASFDRNFVYFTLQYRFREIRLGH